jgi:Recombination endonuclease VII
MLTDEEKKKRHAASVRKWEDAHPQGRSEINRRYRENHPEQVRDSARKYREEHRTERNALSEKYNRRVGGHPEPTRPRPNGCEVCGEVNGAGRLHLDHDHETGKFRGWLCFKCNMSLGYMKDSPELLRALIDYVERNS